MFAEVVTVEPLGKVAEGKVTLTKISLFDPGVIGTANGEVKLIVAGVVPTHPGWQSAAGVAPLKTVPGASVTTTGPAAV